MSSYIVKKYLALVAASVFLAIGVSSNSILLFTFSMFVYALTLLGVGYTDGYRDVRSEYK